jgi:LuxR family transcriptional regulator, maltose regulon positive regulatory protein
LLGGEEIMQARQESGYARPLLRGKLRPPLPRAATVHRRELFDRLQGSVDRALTLVSAPAGSGKTTLLSAWVAGQPRPAAWIGLDPSDSQLTTFVRYLGAAIQTIAPSFGHPPLGLLQLPQLPPVDYLAASLLDELATLPEASILVVDDYHVIQDPSIHMLLSQLLSGLPPTLHVVLATRADPPLPLARWRVRGQMAELRASDLQFSPGEVQDFLERALGTAPPPGVAAAFVERTEGWIAGVQLASLTLKASSDPIAWTATFRTTTHRHVRDFLLDDVLAEQPANVQAFLLRTAVLDRFCAPLCDALWDEPPQAPGSQEILEHIERENLFVIGLDHEQQWFRYHHLFQESLLHRLRAQSGEQAVADLHRRAGRWLEAAGLIDEALEQVLAASDPAAAARLVETHASAAMNREDWPRLERWVSLLPRDLVPIRPGLLVIQALVQRVRGQWAALGASLRSAETLLREGTGLDGLPAPVVRGLIDALWSDYYFHSGDEERSLAHARRALENLPQEHYFIRGMATICAGVMRYQLGDGPAAVAELRTEWAKGTPASAVYTSRVLISLMSIYRAAADMPRLQEVGEALLQLSSAHALPLSRSWAHYSLGLSAYQRNDLVAAEEHFVAVIDTQAEGHFLAARESLLWLSLTYQAQGRAPLARSTAEQASQLMLDTGNEPQLAMTRAVEARLACLRNDVAAATQWLRSWQDDGTLVSWRLEVPRLTRARVLVAQNTSESLQIASRELAALAEQCAARSDILHLIEILALQAVAYASQDASAEALPVLARAVQLAEPGGVVRPFLDPGSRLADLLRRLVAQGPVLAHASRILEAIASPAPSSEVVAHRPSQPGLMAETLTWREAEVLGLLAARLSNKEIAQQLSISIETVKQHATNIYQKLQVSGRREAVSRARSLGLLAVPAEPDARLLVPLASPHRASTLNEPPAREERTSS